MEIVGRQRALNKPYVKWISKIFVLVKLTVYNKSNKFKTF